MKHVKLFENYERIDSNYERVIPRDLFNEAKLLKSMGRLCLLILDKKTPVEMESEHDGKPFEIALTEDGNLTIRNLNIYINGQVYEFHTTYNSKDNYPLYMIDNEEYVEYEVFDDKGEFSKDFVEFCEKTK